MATKKQIVANRRNAHKSTGPRTPRGKAVCSLNGLRDGLYASTLILPGESQGDFDRLRDRLQADYQPRNPHQQEMVDQLAAIKWKMLRAELVEAGVLIDNGDQPAIVCLAPYDRVTRIQGRLRRDCFRLYKDLETAKAARPKEVPNKEVPKPAETTREISPPHAPDSPPQPAPEEPDEVAEDPDEDQWATLEDLENQRRGPVKNFKIPKHYELTWGQPPQVIARLYKGKSVKEWPADDPPDDPEWIYLEPGKPPRVGPAPGKQPPADPTSPVVQCK